MESSVARALITEAFASFDPTDFVPGAQARGRKSSTCDPDAAIPTCRNDSGLIVSAISSRTFLKEIIENLLPLAGMRVFEIGCGTGYLASVLSKLCGEAGMVYGCEIVPKLVQVAKENIKSKGIRNIQIVEGDFADVLPAHGVFDVVIGTSSMSSMHESIINACNSMGGTVIIPIEIPGGGDCITSFKRTGSTLVTNFAALSLSVPTTGRYTSRAIWAPPVQELIPFWGTMPRTVIQFGENATTIANTLSFRSWLLYNEPLFVAANLETGYLTRESDMAFGLVDSNSSSYCLKTGSTLLLAGRDALVLAQRFASRLSAWEDGGKLSLANYRFRIDLENCEAIDFVPPLKRRFLVYE